MFGLSCVFSCSTVSGNEGFPQLTKQENGATKYPISVEVFDAIWLQTMFHCFTNRAVLCADSRAHLFGSNLRSYPSSTEGGSLQK